MEDMDANTRNRQPAGVPSGGQFAAGVNPEANLELEPSPADDRPYLQDFAIVGFTRKTFSPVAGVNMPGGTCGNCGQALVNCVAVRNTKTGETMDVGLDCAERVGLSRSEVRKLMAERYAEERAAANQARSKAERAEAEAEEAAATAQFGEHGTPGRYSDGDCRCGECRSVAPHGTVDRLEADACYCDECVQAAITDGPYELRERPVLIDADNGKVIEEARIASTRYGSRWVVDRGDGNTDWYPYRPKRRSTMLNKGVLEAAAEHLVIPSKRGLGDFPVARIETPEVDGWGEPIVTGG